MDEEAASAGGRVGDLVEDQQHPQTIADRPDPLPITLGWQLDGGPADRLGDQGANVGSAGQQIGARGGAAGFLRVAACIPALWKLPSKATTPGRPRRAVGAGLDAEGGGRAG